MAEIVIHCIPEPGTDAAEAAAQLETYLRGTDGVEPVLVEVEQPRAGLAEVLTILELANTAIDLAGKLIAFIRSRRDGQRVDIEVEIDGRRVPVGSLTPDQRARLAAALAEGT